MSHLYPDILVFCSQETISRGHLLLQNPSIHVILCFYSDFLAEEWHSDSTQWQFPIVVWARCKRHTCVEKSTSKKQKTATWSNTQLSKTAAASSADKALKWSGADSVWVKNSDLMLLSTPWVFSMKTHMTSFVKLTWLTFFKAKGLHYPGKFCRNVAHTVQVINPRPEGAERLRWLNMT